MTPKEKAEELVKKLFEFNHRVKWDSDNDEWTQNYYLAQQCALIAVDEIAKCTKHEKQEFENDRFSEHYWDEVKQEIEKL
jgi:hypothetical protein